jgi:acyl-CoA synthetase (AMP-forming)/AMP-acid ligase II
MLFRASAAERPSKVAMIFGERTLSYAQLDRWTDAVASFLQAQGVGGGSSVGLWWPRGIELHVAILQA